MLFDLYRQHYEPLTPALFTEVETGLSLPNVFTSETGSATMSSFESMSPFLESQLWGIHGGMRPDVCTTDNSSPE